MQTNYNPDDVKKVFDELSREMSIDFAIRLDQYARDSIEALESLRLENEYLKKVVEASTNLARLIYDSDSTIVRHTYLGLKDWENRKDEIRYACDCKVCVAVRAYEKLTQSRLIEDEIEEPESDE